MLKKILLSSLLIVSCFSFSQGLRETRFGLIAQGNYSGIRSVHNPSEQKIGYNFGALALIPLVSDQFFIQPQLEYVNAGEKGENDTKYINNYLSVPILAKAYFSEAESEFFAILGPRVSFLMNQKVINPSEPRYQLDQQGKANSIDLALVGGLGFSYLRKHEITLRVDIGLSDVYKNLDDSGLDAKAAPKNTQNVILLGYSYIFN